MYRPNFCVECGARLERKHWHWWTSGRFCAACEKRFRRRRWLMPLGLGAVLLSIGFVAGRAGRMAPRPPIVIKRGGAEVFSRPATDDAAVPPPPASVAGPAAAGAPSSAPRSGADGTTATERPTTPSEIVSMCGARTKKGTPCSRRVRGTGRCWQHRGMPAMLPASKLIVPE